MHCHNNRTDVGGKFPSCILSKTRVEILTESQCYFSHSSQWCHVSMHALKKNAEHLIHQLESTWEFPTLLNNWGFMLQPHAHVQTCNKTPYKRLLFSLNPCVRVCVWAPVLACVWFINFSLYKILLHIQIPHRYEEPLWWSWNPKTVT